MGSSLARVICETSRVLLAGDQMVFLGDLPFSPTLRLTRLKMSEIILTGRKTQIRKKIIISQIKHIAVREKKGAWIWHDLFIVISRALTLDGYRFVKHSV